MERRGTGRDGEESEVLDFFPLAKFPAVGKMCAELEAPYVVEEE